jgi:carboxyl-terminal processing protease
LKFNGIKSIKSWKKISLHPAVLVIGVLVIAVASFYGGDILAGTIPLPGLKFSRSIDFSSLNSLYTLLQRNYDGSLSNQAALDGARAGLVASAGDPYTEYFTASEANALNQDLNGQLSGIGAEIGMKNGSITIIAPIAGTPAQKAGLQDGDIISRINNNQTVNLTVDQAVSEIRGPAGTKVTLQIVRSGQVEPFNVTITRANITVPSVNWKMEPNSTIGYINITQFAPDTASLMNQAATALKSQGAKSIILDLRDDPGGYLDAAVSVASEFLPSGKTVVSERTGGVTVDTLYAQSGGELIGLPTVVLINSGSASASEIVSGALHDNGVAKLEGETSFGKGSVQTIKNLPGGAELKVTIAHWYTPNGININKKGITPDVQVPLTTADYDAGQDPQLAKAIQMLQ